MRMIDSRQLIMAASIFGLAFSGFSGSTWGANTTLSTKVVTVDCDAAQGPSSLQADLDKAVPGLTIEVSGTCSEPDGRFRMRTDNVTIDGQGTDINLGTGEVTGGAILDGRISVRGNNVKIRNLTLRGVGGSSGIVVNFGASATIQGSVIKGHGNNGVSINQGGYGLIGSDRRNHIEVGETASQGNLIQDNEGAGIGIRLGGAADVAHNLIIGNDDGISVGDGAAADIGANVIRGNDGRGVNVFGGSVASFDDSGHEVPNNIREPNTIEANGEGIRCRLGAIISGVAQGFGEGNPGASDHSKDILISDCHVGGEVDTPAP